jgi:hypothetical protein
MMVTLIVMGVGEASLRLEDVTSGLSAERRRLVDDRLA